MRQEVGEIFRVIADDETGDVDARRLKVHRHRVEEIIMVADWHAVIAHERIREDEDLALVGGVGEGLYVADHAC